MTLEGLSNPLRDVKKTFDEMIIPHRPALWSYCYRITGSPWDAEDLVQETLIKAFSSLTKIWQPINPKGYLFRIASNTWIDQCRRMKLKVDSFETENEQGYEEQMDAFEIEGAMEHLVMYLPPRQRVVLLLMDVFQFKAKEVGEMIGSSEGAIKALLHRARGTLKKIKERQSVEDKSVISHKHSEIVNAFIQAFNQRDPDGIASLLDDHVSNDIVHIAQEYGKEIVRKHSLEDWAKDPVQMTAELHYLWGRPTIVQLGILQNERAIYDLNLLDIEKGKITGMKDYYFCPELLNEAAKQLNIKAFARSYTFS